MSTPREIAKIRKMMNLETNTLNTAYYDSDSIVNTANTGVQTPVGTISVSSADTLPLSNIPIGQQGFVTTTNKLYIYNGSGWYNIAAINNAPYWDTEANATYALAVNGTSTVVTLAAGDSDGTTLSYTATGDSNFNAIATVTKDSDNGRVFTITPIDSENSASPTAGSGILTFRASDGIDQASTASTFTISFSPDWASGSITKTELTYTNATNQNRFVTISPDGNYVVSGDYIAHRVNVQYYNGSSWSEQATFQSSDGVGTYMGTSIAISDDVTYIAAGASAGETGGSVYIFTRSGSTWTQQAELVSSDNNTGDYFVNVSSNSDMTQLCIGASADDGQGNTSGGAYIFTRSGSTWTQKTKFYSSDIAAGDGFGYVTLSNSTGDFVVVSAPTENSNEGAVYTFNVTNNGSTVTQQQKLTCSTGSAGSGRFGWAVAMSSDTNYIAVGDRRFNSEAGQVTVFAKSGGTYSQQQIITSSDIQTGDQFGVGVALNSDGTLMAITAWEEDGGPGDPNSNDGSLYIYERNGSTWSEIKIIRAADIFDDTATATVGVTGVASSSDFSRLAIAGGGGTANISILDV